MPRRFSIVEKCQGSPLKQASTIHNIELSMSARPQPSQAFPTRTAKTDAAYARRYRQLSTAARSDAAAADGTPPPFTANAFVDWLLAKRSGYRSNSWRQVRAAACFGMKEDAERNPQRAPAISAAIAKLVAAAPERGMDLPSRTSSTKAKRFPEGDLDRTCFAALASRSPNGGKLVKYLRASALCGCRPCEWPGAIFRKSEAAGFDWELIVRNAKNSNDRSTGEIRTLRWPELADDQVEDVAAWIALSSQDRYDTLMGTLASLLARLAKRLFPRRTSLPSLYSTRHEAAARWKARYVVPDQSPEMRTFALAVVAALLGHASDESAAEHYGRPRRGGKKEVSRFPSPHADPSEVAKVRHRFNLTLLPPRIVEMTSDRSEEPNTLPPPLKKS
jgi:integrase